jgi:hypothetical protein
MDWLPVSDERRQRLAAVLQATSQRVWPNQSATAEPAPHLEDWLRYWNDDDTDLGNLRNLEHWLSRSRRDAA